MKRRKSIIPPWALALVTLIFAAAVVLVLYLDDGGQFSAPPPDADPEGFYMAFIDVGQGDSILIHSEGKYMLIDAATVGDSQNVINYLDSKGVKRLDYLIATHPHADHIGGMAKVLDTYEVGTFIMPRVTHTTATFERMLDAAAANGCDGKYAAKGQEYTLGNAKITILSPESAIEFDNLNNYSVVTSIEIEGHKMLLSGDAEAEVEAQLVADGIGRHILMKAGHHGSSTSNSEALLEAVSPQCFIISAGAGNDYGHPHKEIIERTKNMNVFRTDLQGTVLVSITEGKLYVQTER